MNLRFLKLPSAAGAIAWAVTFLGTVGLVGPPAALAVAGCNLAPNPAFENVVGGAQPLVGWNYQKFGIPGSATYSIATWPNPVQSGATGAKIVVTVVGDIELATVPEKTAIPVSPSTSYRVSTNVKTELGKYAGVNIVEWSQTGTALNVQWFTVGGATTNWESFENLFTTGASTRYVSIRLMHHISTGTFYWDDVRLWQEVAGQKCFDARHYIVQSTPGERLCTPGAGSVCIDGAKNSGGEFVRDISNGIRDVISHSGDGVTGALGIGVVKNLDPGTGGTWRCFSDPGQSCSNGSGPNAHYPAVNNPLMAVLPVLASIPDPTHRTTGAGQLNDWQAFDTWALNPVSGSQVGSVSAGPIWQRAWGFFLQSMNFGGDVGTRQNVAVFEYEGIGTNPVGFPGGNRLERYYYVQGLGQVRAEGWQDDDCVAAPSPVTCDGNYSNNVNGSATFNMRFPIDFQYNVGGLPWVLNDWWK